MGANSPFNEPGHQSSLNGDDSFHYPANWRDSVVNQRPKKLVTKKAVILFSFDLVTLCYLIGIVDYLSSVKEVVAWFVGIAYLTGRAGVVLVKMFAFMGKNSDFIKKGFRLIKEMFKE